MEELKVNHKPDSTKSHWPLSLQDGIKNWIHCWLLLNPICTSIQGFWPQKELLHVFIDCIKGMFQAVSKFCAALIYLHIIAHLALVNINILHHDISMANLALVCAGGHEYGKECSPHTLRRGVLIDFDCAMWMSNVSHTISKIGKTVCNNYILYRCMLMFVFMH